MASPAPAWTKREQVALLSPFKLVARDESCSYGWSEQLKVCLSVGRAAPTSATALHLRRVFQGLSNHSPDGFGQISVIRDGSTPDTKARDIIANTFQEHWDRLHGTVFVLEAGGFQAAIQRSFIGAAVFATGLRSRIRVTGNLDEALPWFVEKIAATGQKEVATMSLRRAVVAFCNAESVPSLPMLRFQPLNVPRSP
jgi:hypothetical protein